jgi:hypothetical protein
MTNPRNFLTESLPCVDPCRKPGAFVGALRIPRIPSDHECTARRGRNRIEGTRRRPPTSLTGCERPSAGRRVIANAIVRMRNEENAANGASPQIGSSGEPV